LGERSFFGTDGIRGEANIHPMTTEVAMNLGRAVTYYFQKYSQSLKGPLIIVGKDTRLSCYMLEQAFSAGVCAQGGRVILTGPLPTPAISFATCSMRANAGVMISASHNPFYDNGIKIFDHCGEKLPDSVEMKLEKMIQDPSLIPSPHREALGKASRMDEVLGRYIVHVKSCFDQKYSLEGMKIVIDCANGAAYKVAPLIFEELGAEVVTLGVSPDGLNINDHCGSLHPEKCAKLVLDHQADIGICLDGDADRLTVIDNKGEVVHGDILIGLFAKLMLDRGLMNKGDEVVGTVMTNLGLEVYLKELGLNLVRTKVGDRYILEYMQKSEKALLGGEPSGHIIFPKWASTGDGILAGLKILEAIKFYDCHLSDLQKNWQPYPQQLISIEVKEKPPMEEVTALILEKKAVEKEMGDKGRVVLRYSGTEKLARVMVEGSDPLIVDQMTKRLVDVVKQELC